MALRATRDLKTKMPPALPEARENQALKANRPDFVQQVGA
jgi:hypothetical protein